MTPGGRSGGLDAMRAIAALLVFGFHAQPATTLDLGLLGQGGGVGVVIFFVLSGYLLYRPFVTRTPDLERYAVKRVARIYPAYLFALVGVAALNGGAVLVAHPLTFAVFGQNYDPATFEAFLAASWTLAIEVVFYVLLPVIAWAVRPNPVLGLTILGLLSLLARAFVWPLLGGMTDPQASQVMALFPLMFCFFVPGMLVAVRMPPAPLWPVGVALIVGALYLSPAAFGIRPFGGLVVIGPVAAIGAALTLPAALAWSAPRALAWFGDRLSYAFYLWHGEVFSLAAAVMVLLGLQADSWFIPIAFALACVIAWVSSVVVEQPAMRAADAWLERRRAVPVPA